MQSKYFLDTDEDYLKFNQRLIFTGYPMQGVRLPVIKKLALSLKADKDVLSMQPVTYEEVMLKGLVIAFSGFDIDTLLKNVDAFLPLIDNWAVCDSFLGALKAFNKHKAKVLEHYTYLKTSENIFDRRFLAVLLLNYFLVDEYIDTALDLLLLIKSGEYYVDMAIAWTIATAAAKYFDKAYRVLTSGKLSPFILSKSISKSLESFRVSNQQKDILRQLRQTKMHQKA